MYPTDKQAQTIEELTRTYGQPEAILHEATSEPYGLIRLEWPNALSPGYAPQRMLFVKPDGSRLAWTMVHP